MREIVGVRVRGVRERKLEWEKERRGVRRKHEKEHTSERGLEEERDRRECWHWAGQSRAENGKEKGR